MCVRVCATHAEFKAHEQFVKVPRSQVSCWLCASPSIFYNFMARMGVAAGCYK